MGQSTNVRQVWRAALIIATIGALRGMQCPVDAILDGMGDEAPIAGACLPEDPNCEDTIIPLQ